MPISIDEFEAHDPDAHPTTAENVIRFLAQHHDQAFKVNEIAEETGVNANPIHPVLHRLKEQKLVRHRAPYWAIGDRETVQKAALLHEATEHLNTVLGPESKEKWLRAANNAQQEEP